MSEWKKADRTAIFTSNECIEYTWLISITVSMNEGNAT